MTKETDKSRHGGRPVSGAATASTSAFKARFSDLRQRKTMTQQEVAAFLGVGLKTVQNWESGNIVPRRGTVEEIAKKLEVPPSYFYPVPRPVEAIKALADIFDREKYCSEVWILKTGRPFVSGENPALRRQMLDLMKDAGVMFYFVCPGPECDGLAQHAYLSHQQFLAQVRELQDKEVYLQHSRWVEVPDSQAANSLGLVDDWMSFVCARYSDSGIRKWGKVLDVWIEFALDTDRSSDGVRKEWFWVELSKNEAESWWGRRWKTLQKLAGEQDRQAESDEAATEQAQTSSQVNPA